MHNSTQKVITGVWVDPIGKKMHGADVALQNGRILSITPRADVHSPFILPGFIDAHVHIESSMLIPSRFAAMAVQHGTVGVVTDPHEVANVAGVEGIEFMMQDAGKVPVGFYFGVPSCVPASPLEKSGAVITAREVKELLQKEDFYYLSEMMNFPGVVNQDPEVLEKLRWARAMGKPVDGHSPGLAGEALQKYIQAGITTDHECSTLEEAAQKIALGMKILIREGSAAKNFDNLIALLRNHADKLMFCTDDCHPDYLQKGHINKLVSRAVKAGYNLFDVLKVACINPVKHYHLPLGTLQPGDQADLVVVKDLLDFEVLATYIKGQPVFEKEQVLFSLPDAVAPDFTFRKSHEPGRLEVIATSDKFNLIHAIEGELYTQWTVEECVQGQPLQAEIQKDWLKLVLLDRYSESPPVVAFVKGFGLKQGALACSVAHDSHHIIAVGCDDQSIDAALQWIVENRGGLCAAVSDGIQGIPLPFFGLMSSNPAIQMAHAYEELNAKTPGSKLSAPFMTLSFMALTVIPKLKINHNGLFDGLAFKSIPLFV